MSARFLKLAKKARNGTVFFRPNPPDEDNNEYFTTTRTMDRYLNHDAIIPGKKRYGIYKSDLENAIKALTVFLLKRGRTPFR